MRSIEACQDGSWSLATWKKADGEDPKASPFRCRSWRHEGDCRAECGACDFARISQALGEHGHWTYIVLTYPAKEWPDVARLFRFGLVSWARLRKRLIRQYGNILYIQTWEIHNSGYPHVNVVISSEPIQSAAAAEAKPDYPKFLSPLAKECGFGWKCYAEPMKSPDALAGYLTKLALELTGAARKNQIPINAPRHFRRIRASRGLLPKRFKNEDYTGQLFKMPYHLLNDQLEGKLSKQGSTDHDCGSSD